MTRIGAHVPTAGGLGKRPVAYAETIRADVIQIFVSNPRGWAHAAGIPEQDELFRSQCSSQDIVNFIHAPFLINLGSPTLTTYENSLASTSHALMRGRELHSQGVVVHTGSAVDVSHVERAWKQIHDGVMPILERLGDEDPWLLLEPTAGQGQSLCRTIDDLSLYMDALEHHPKVGICLDTCHVFAAGHDISQPGGMDEAIDLLIQTVGPDRLKLIHANDSMDICGSLKDRHASIGAGEIGIEPFRELLAHPAIADTPLVLETPGNEPEHGREVALLRGLLA
jgi:deoxyribonuclease IV